MFVTTRGVASTPSRGKRFQGAQSPRGLAPPSPDIREILTIPRAGRAVDRDGWRRMPVGAIGCRERGCVSKCRWCVSLEYQAAFCFGAKVPSPASATSPGSHYGRGGEPASLAASRPETGFESSRDIKTLHYPLLIVKWWAMGRSSRFELSRRSILIGCWVVGIPRHDTLLCHAYPDAMESG